MNIKPDTEARVFDIKAEEGKNVRRANLSTYEGKDKEGNNKYSSWPARFVGSAYEKSAGLSDKDRIILTNAKIENDYNKESNKAYLNLTVFDFEFEINTSDK